MAQSVGLGGKTVCPVSFVSWNVKGINHLVKRKKILAHLHQLQTDIAFLLETHLDTFNHAHLHSRWVGAVYHSTFQFKSRGVAILIRKYVPFTPFKIDVDPKGRYVIVIGKIYDMPVVLVSVYAPNWDDAAFFTNLFSRLPDLNEHRLIVGGDMNCVLSPGLDRSSDRDVPISKAALTVKMFLDTYGVADVWRVLNPTARKYSFYSAVHKTYSHIDYIFMDKNLLPLVQECDYHTIVISDHAPHRLKLDLPAIQPVYRPWRLNSLLFSDKKILDFVSAQIDFFLELNQTPDMSPSIVWEALKAYLRGQIISYTAQLRKIRNKRINQLSKQIGDLDAQLATSYSEDGIKERVVLQKEFNLLTTQKVENLLVRARHINYEHGEKTGKLLAHQLHRKAASHTISEIRDESGGVCLDHAAINLRFMRYYRNLYTLGLCIGTNLAIRYVSRYRAHDAIYHDTVKKTH